MPVQNFSIAYPDFKMGDKIDPEQFDSNNKTVVDKLNEVINVLNNDKTDLLGDHKGTWQGLTPGGSASESINGSRLDALEPQVTALSESVDERFAEVNLFDGRIDKAESTIQHMQKNISNLALQQEASKRVINGHTLGTDFVSLHNLTIDNTKTTLTSAVAINSSLINVANSAGFAVGEDVYIVGDNTYDKVTISSVTSNSIAISPTTKAFATGALLVKSMIDSDGYFVTGNRVIESTFETDSSGWGVEGSTTLSYDTSWKTEGTRSIKATSGGATGDWNDAILSKSYDASNINNVSFDARVRGHREQLAGAYNGNNFFSIGGTQVYSGAVVADTDTLWNARNIDVRRFAGNNKFLFNINDEKDGYVYVNLDNVIIEYFAPVAEFVLNVPSTQDCVVWIETDAGISLEAYVGNTQMTKVVSGLETQFSLNQATPFTKVRIVATTQAGAKFKINKVLGGYA